MLSSHHPNGVRATHFVTRVHTSKVPPTVIAATCHLQCKQAALVLEHDAPAPLEWFFTCCSCTLMC
jgi:hypothetical protein